MPTLKKVIVPSNLSNQFLIDTAASKIKVNIDGTTIVADASGVLSSSGGVITPSVTVGHVIATALQSGVTTDVKETITKIVDALNTVTYTDEAGTDTVSTKIASVVHTLDPTAKTLKTSVNGVDSNVLDVSALYADINVDTVNWDASTYVLTLTETDSTVHTLNLASLVAISTIAGDTVTLTGNGTVATPLKAEVKLDTSTNNLAKSSATGFMVDKTDILALHLADIELQDAFGVTLGFIHTTTNM